MVAMGYISDYLYTIQRDNSWDMNFYYLYIYIYVRVYTCINTGVRLFYYRQLSVGHKII